MTLISGGRTRSRNVALACASLSLLAGCSGSGSGGLAPATVGTSALSSSPAGGSVRSERTVASVADDAAPLTQVIVADSGLGNVSVFDAAGHLQTRLKKGLHAPGGLTTDPAGNLYVSNTQAHNVLIYAQPYAEGTLKSTLDDAGEYPTDVAVSESGVVAATNIQSQAGTGGNVAFYAKGATTACASVSDPGWNGMQFGAFDASGNLFIVGINQSGDPIAGEISGGCSATSVVTLSAANPFTANLAGVQVVNGNILILDQDYNTFAPVIYTYAPPSKGSLGSPIATTALTAGIEMTGFAMTKDDKHLWIAHSDEDYGGIEYTYPAGKFVNSFNEPNLVTEAGIAVNPAARP